jgi:hypothetical protein
MRGSTAGTVKRPLRQSSRAQLRATPVRRSGRATVLVDEGQVHLSTLKKSHASMPVACARTNSVQLGPLGRGAGPSRCRRRIRRTGVADTRMPSLRHSPTILMYPHREFSRAIRRTSSTVSESSPRLPSPVAG